MASIDYNDERFAKVESQKQEALNNANNTYNNMINGSDQFYQGLVDANNQYAEEQKANQQAMTDQQLAEVEQQKQYAQKDYEKEQRAAYVDYMKKTDKYGSNAEAMASLGLTNSGVNATNQTAMFNAYQSRVATARESINRSFDSYNNQMANIKLQNSSKLSEIAYNALKNKLELGLQGFQYKNQLLIDQLNKQNEINNTYYNRYQDVVNQINTENSLAESIRQYNEKMAYQRERDAVSDAQWQKEYNLSKKKVSSSGSSKKTEESTIKQSEDNKTGSTTLTSIKTPILSGKKVQSWFDLNFKSNMKDTDLAKLIANAPDYVSKEDINKIYKVYGLN